MLDILAVYYTSGNTDTATHKEHQIEERHHEVAGAHKRELLASKTCLTKHHIHSGIVTCTTRILTWERSTDSWAINTKLLNKDEIATLYCIGGLPLFDDLKDVAMDYQDYEDNYNEAKEAWDKAQREWEQALSKYCNKK